MEQLTLPDWPVPYKYIIDTSSILSQKENEPHRRQVYKSLWKRIDESISAGIIVICSEIYEEVKDEKIRDWLQVLQCKVLDIDNEVQVNVRKIVTEHPEMIEFTGRGGTSSGDAFLIATAMKYKLIIITEESKEKQKKIPKICENYDVETVNLTELCDKEKWEF